MRFVDRGRSTELRFRFTSNFCSGRRYSSFDFPSSLIKVGDQTRAATATLISGDQSGANMSDALVETGSAAALAPGRQSECQWQCAAPRRPAASILVFGCCYFIKRFFKIGDWGLLRARLHPNFYLGEFCEY